MSSQIAVMQHPETVDDQDIRDTLVQRAHDMIPDLVARQAETEARTYYSEETHRAFEKAGLYGILVPEKFGGLDLDVKTYYRVVMELATGCPSTAWQFCLGSAHAVTLCGMYSEEAQREVFDIDEPFIAATTTRPQGKAIRLPDGGWQLDGEWNYCSGIPYSSHFLSHTIATNEDGSDPELMTFIVPRDQWTRLDDWGAALGLKGSGSHSIKLENARIPASWGLKGRSIIDHRLPPKSEIDTDLDNPLYFGGTMSLWLLEPAALCIGMVKGALEECTKLMQTKTTVIPPITLRGENTDYQRWYGAAAAKLTTAESAYHDACEKWTEDARLQMLGLRDPNDPRELLSNVICGEVIEMAWEAMQLLYRVAGTGAAMDGQRMQRIYRDLSTARSHAYNTRFDGLHRELSVNLTQQPA
ncbi:acyl-CoA dehydrogenase family protein [Croceicoccus sediminis]|uniref:acyl-CoA dehydrogenase family protein n=1 Tax=Croceicoccus sediminis TaxID=2571150 RepID=UPI001182B83D|nr:acyl-CoA dehydrogenase family protein [Croceicoccus sediminis]